MLNKKAIAALAAGATLVSGLAFATPSFAADCPVNKDEWALRSVNDALTTQAKTAYETAKAAVPAKPTKPTEPTKAEVKALYEADGNEGKLKMKAVQANADPANIAEAQNYVTLNNQYVTDQANYTTKSAEAQRLYNAYLVAKDFAENCSKPDPDKKQEAIDAVRDAAKNLQNADNDFAKAKKAYYAAKDAFLKAQAELNARTAAYNAATTALENFRASGVNDSAKEQHLADAVNRANAHLARATEAYGKAEADYNKTYADALAAKQAYNDALQAYKNAYDAAVAAGVNPALLPPVKTADPLDESFNPVPGAKELYAEALSGKFGKAVQAAAKKGQKEAKKGEAKKEAGKKGASAAAPAGAKLDTKAAAAASAAPLSKTGVTVMFTALAASMLAGIGAAVRKFRH
ncbi:hypothetical protein [Gardnerella sp. KA00255]|uniref:hypothetical protein n=1 Tax=Gardnerella sp. KA00255 TaxID=2749073 RepID=UPI003BABA7AC